METNLSIIIVNYKTRAVLRECLERLRASEGSIKKETIVVDSASSDGSAKMVRRDFPEVILIESKNNNGFAAANAEGFKRAAGKYILLLNPDVFVKEDTIQKATEFIDKNSECGILGIKLFERDASPHISGGYFPTPARQFFTYTGLSRRFSFLKGIDCVRDKRDAVCEVDWVPGCFLLTRRSVIDEAGFLDTAYFLYREDIDFCLRAKRKGWKVLFFPRAEATHLHGESAKNIGKITPESRMAEDVKLSSEFFYYRKNYGVFCVLADLFFVLLFDASEIIKKIILRKERINIVEKTEHIKLAVKVLARTGLGRRSLGRKIWT